MTSLDFYDVVNVFKMAEITKSHSGLSESDNETLVKFYSYCNVEQQKEIQELFPEVVETKHGFKKERLE